MKHKSINKIIFVSYKIYSNQSFRIHTLSIKLIEAISHYCPPAPAHGAPCGYAPPANTSLSQLKAHHAYIIRMHFLKSS